MNIYENYIFENSTGVTHYVPIASVDELDPEEVTRRVQEEAQRREIIPPFHQMVAPRSMFADAELVVSIEE